MSELEEAIRLRDKFKRQAEETPAYRAWKAMEVVVQQLQNVPVEVPASTYSQADQSKGARRRTYADTACDAIADRLRPMTTLEILDLLIEKNLATEETKTVNVASSLSRDERLISVSFEGQRQWWFANKPLPSSAEPSLMEAGGDE